MFSVCTDEDWLEKKRRADELMGLPTRRPLPKHKYSALEKLTQDRLDQAERAALEQQQQQQRPPPYLYPLQKPAYIVPASNSSSNSRLDSDEQHYVVPKEEEIKPKIVRPMNLDFKQLIPSNEMDDEDEDDDDDDQDFHNDEIRFRNENVKYRGEKHLNEKNKKMLSSDAVKHLQRTRSASHEVDEPQYRHRRSNGNAKMENKMKYRCDDDDEEDEIDADENQFNRYRENLTDKQKYRESLIEKQRYSNGGYRERQLDDGFRIREPIPIESKCSGGGGGSSKAKYEPDEVSNDRKGYRQKMKASNGGYEDCDFDRNPYKEADSLPYRESIERMMRSPAIQYKSYEDRGFVDEPLIEKYREMRVNQYPNEIDEQPRHGGRQRYKDHKHRSQSRSPDTVMRVPPLERFQNAKEKFKAIEREHPFVVEQVVSDRPWNGGSGIGGVADKIRQSRRMPEPPRHLPPLPMHSQLDWSSEDEQIHSMQRQSAGSRRLPPQQSHQLDWSSEDEQMHPTSNVRVVPREHYEKNPQRIASSKSLGNLVKGYRHSYAEPRAPVPRNSGRVGLAAVNPY